MELNEKGSRKRKSAGVGDIFEVSDNDLSPESEEIDNEEPLTKVVKTRDSDISESRRDVLQNLKVEQEFVQKKVLCEKETIDLTNVDTGINYNDNVNTSDKPLANSIIVLDDTLEDGEVQDTNLDNTLSTCIPLQPSISIQFSSKAVGEMYKPKFLDFINSFIELDIKVVDDTSIHILKNKIDPFIVIDTIDSPLDSSYTTQTITPVKEVAKELPATPKSVTSKKKKNKKKLKLAEEVQFVVDTKPGIETRESFSAMYSTKFLINDESENRHKEISKPTASSMCFNCEKNHSLRDCPQPKNYSNINANRQKFANKNKTSRYHLEDDQKYNHLQPGKISPALRKALGLKRNQLPSFIYQMRILGYPPGWLEEAKVVESKLRMYDIDGKNVKNTNIKTTRGLDPEKVVCYPGFNIPLEREYKDEYKYHRVPPYSDDFSKDKMIDYFKEQCLKNEDDLETQDMDLDNASDLIVLDDLEECTEMNTIQNKHLGLVIDSDSHTVPSPSLLDLEIQKTSLLEELKKPEKNIPWDYTSEDTSQSNLDEPRKSPTESKKEPGATPDNTPEECCDKSSDSDGNKDSVCKKKTTITEIKHSQKPSSPKVKSVKHSMFGTPILKGMSPYIQLPDSDRFQKGVSPVIDFENLPNSTGKYEQMTGVLQKVRDTLKNKYTKQKLDICSS